MDCCNAEDEYATGEIGSLEVDKCGVTISSGGKEGLRSIL